MTEQNPLRADAKRNRERILTAAEAIFMERGANASLDEVAKRAGVGIGTLYRRFSTREELLAAAYSARFLAFAEASRAADKGADPLQSLRIFLEELVRCSNIYRGFAATLGTVLGGDTPGCRATSAEGERLLENARYAGVVRRDVTFSDIVWVGTAISLATEGQPSQDSRISHLADVFLNGIASR